MEYHPIELFEIGNTIVDYRSTISKMQVFEYIHAKGASSKYKGWTMYDIEEQLNSLWPHYATLDDRENNYHITPAGVEFYYKHKKINEEK